MTAPTMHPTAYADQLAAATAEARHALQDAAHQHATQLADIPATGWLAQQAETLRAAILDGTADCCPHISNAPRVAHAAAWAPGRLVCPACAWRLAPAPAEDATCDRCRRHVRNLHAGAAAFGPVLLGYGLCARCLNDTGLDTRKEHQ